MNTLVAAIAVGLALVAASTAGWTPPIVEYGGAVHGFTNPENGNDNSKGLAYDERADRRSWEAMNAFFEEALK